MIDADTGDMLYQHYQFRYVVDPDRFSVYFHRLLMEIGLQWSQMMVLDSATWDPMVQQYMERRTVIKETSKGTSSGKASGTSTGTRNDTTTHSGEDKRVHDTTDEGTDWSFSNGNGSASSTGSHNETTTHSGEDKRAHDTKDEGTDWSFSHGTGTSHNEGASHNQSEAHGTQSGLAGDTPDSTMYPAGGYPDKLAWKYASSQQESKTDQNDVADANEHSDANNESNQEASSGRNGHTVGTDTVTYGQGTTTTGEDSRTDSNESHQDASSGRNGHSVGTDTVTYGQGTTTTGEDSRTDSNESNTSSSGSRDGDHREISTGRGEAPQDLMARARSYIASSNSFKWLCKQVDGCFLAFFEKPEERNLFDWWCGM